MLIPSLSTVFTFQQLSLLVNGKESISFHHQNKNLETLLCTKPKFSRQLSIAFAGGFGSSKTVSSSRGTKNSNKKKKRASLLSEELIIKPSPTSSTTTNTVEEPKLDRFGLPILTADNIFAPLPSDTELIGVSNDEKSTNMETIRRCMEKYVSFDFNLFDDDGVEILQDKHGDLLGKNDALPWTLKLLHQSPPVLSIENFFSSAECEEYMKLTQEPKDMHSDSEKSSTGAGPLRINSATFSTFAQSRRTSTTWYCHYRQVPTLLAKAKRLLNNLPLAQMEEAQIVRYRTGEEFSWHYDEIPKEQLSNGGQRIATLLVYLNTLSNEGGGGTIFRDLKGVDGVEQLTMRPKIGSALLFFPSLADGTPDDRTLHKGEVAVEEKMIAQMWIHERPYRPVVPEGNNHEDAVELIKSKENELGYTTL
mmetsp:Transcript_13782/g.16735  ORF Transcript_13782/g.16735 Transcript_13782/m.16735 type:complete len:421 (-) Transcript_13782:11-1273(-)